MEGGSVDWWQEVRTAVLITVFAALLGALVGVIWHAVAPALDIHAAAADLEEATKPLAGDDLWLAMIGAAAGVLCVLAVVLVDPDAFDGPGAHVGLVAGGIVAMVVADRVGYRIGVPSLESAFRAIDPSVSTQGVHAVVGLLGFKVRAKAVLLSWPTTSLVLSMAIAWVRSVNQPTRPATPSYPGTP